MYLCIRDHILVLPSFHNDLWRVKQGVFVHSHHHVLFYHERDNERWFEHCSFSPFPSARSLSFSQNSFVSLNISLKQTLYCFIHNLSTMCQWYPDNAFWIIKILSSSCLFQLSNDSKTKTLFYQTFQCLLRIFISLFSW